MQRQHEQPGLEQPLNQHPIAALDRDDLHVKAAKRVAQRGDPLLVVRRHVDFLRVRSAICLRAR